MKPEISVVIPTFRRPDRIPLVVASVLAQQNITANVEIIILDNDPAASAKDVVIAINKITPRWPVVYGHEPAAGVANARNAALGLAQGKYIAFLDDDETATDTWLHDLLEVQRETNADIVFGPVQGRLEQDAPHQEYIEASFSRYGPDRSGLIEEFFGCGNSLFHRENFFTENQVFNPATNEIGGEDCELFARVEDDGGTFAWAANAWVYEEVPPTRASLRYNLIKAFAFGQGPTQTAWQRRRWLEVLYWMGIGAAQAVIYGALCGPLWLLKTSNRADICDRAAQGLGKLFWFRGFEPKFYGTSGL